MNGTLSFYECRFSVGDIKLYHMQKNCFEIFALTGNKLSGESRPKSYHCGTFTTFNCSSGAMVSLAHVKMSPILSQ